MLAGIVKVLNLPDHIDRGLLLEILLAREEMGSTAIGEGIAIPHPRNPIVLNMDAPSIALCFLRNPIEFGALDGQPVKALFTMISPTVPSHLGLLSRLMFMLRQPIFKALVKKQAPAEAILSAVRGIEASLASTGLPSDE